MGTRLRAQELPAPVSSRRPQQHSVPDATSKSWLSGARRPLVVISCGVRAAKLGASC